MSINIPRKTFDPHPVGRHTGTIVAVEDLGLQESEYGVHHRVTVRVESDSVFQDDGTLFSILQWLTLSSSPKSNLRKFREAVLDRSLTREEEAGFDPETELIGKRISYRVDHREKQDGGLRAVIREGSVEPMAPERIACNGDEADPAGTDATGTTTEDSLPF